jgi:hypothetical protein
VKTTRSFYCTVAALGYLLGLLPGTSPVPAYGAWVTPDATKFQVGGKLAEVVPMLDSNAPGIANSPALVDPTCVSQGGTSLALVRGRHLMGVDPVLYPIVLVVSCLGGNAATQSRLNFVNPIDFIAGGTLVHAGTVVKQLTTTAVPSNGWAHLVNRPDKGDLLGCGADGSLYSIDYSQTNSVIDGTATPLSTPALGSCGGLAWDAENDMIYQGVSSNGNKIGSVVRFKQGAMSPDASFTTSLSCPANGLAISGGVVLVSCAGLVNIPLTNTTTASTLVIQRLNKSTGASVGTLGTSLQEDLGYPRIVLPVPGSGTTALTALSNDPGLGDLACDAVTFQRDTSSSPLGRDLYHDTMWSRRGASGNMIAGLEFPPYTCGLPSNSVVVQNGVSFSPLAAGLSTGTAALPGQSPLATCFVDSNGIVVDTVVDTDGDGLPDCWEANNGGNTGSGGIDFDGDGTTDTTLCAQVDTNGDGNPDPPPGFPIGTPWCADKNHKDLFVEVGWMANHKPDPLALSQTQSVETVGVQSVREAFGAAPVSNPDKKGGIRLHTQVDKQAVTFLNFTGTAMKSEVTNVALTPCTAPASFAPDPNDAADYDAIKATNFGMFDAANPPGAKAVNAMRLAFRYVLFAHNLVGNPAGGSSSSGCSEVGGDDAVVSLGSFTTTTVNGISHPRGTTDQQAGTFMHEFGHLLGLEHGGEDTINNKPNYRSVMSYSRQFSGSPITGRRLDYSRSRVDLDEANLNECNGIGSDSSLGPIPIPGSNPVAYYFATKDQIAFGPGAWAVVTAWPVLTSNTTTRTCSTVGGPAPVNWDRQTSQGQTFQSDTSADINSDNVEATLLGSNDWDNVLYRFSAGIDFAGGRGETLTTSLLSEPEMTKEDETANFLKKDVDVNGIGDGTDCGGQITTDANGVATTTFPCIHRIDIKPSFSFPKTISLGAEATLSVAIFSEIGSTVWDATKQVITLTNGCTASTPPCLTFSVEGVVEPVKTNKNGQGTCSAQDLPDPLTGQKDGVKDLKCQFSTSGLPAGTHFGVVSGYFEDPLDKDENDNPKVKAFDARQEVTILP